MKKINLLLFFSLFCACISVQNKLNAQCLSTTITATDGTTEVTTCPGDGEPDIIRFRPNLFGTFYMFVVTDTSNIILTSFFGSATDFEGAGEGVCRVWGVSFSGVVNVPIGENISTAQFSDFCYLVSDNFVTIIRSESGGGSVQTTTGQTEVNICAGDGEADLVEFETTSDAEQHTFIITDEDNIIVGLPQGNSQDFDGAGIGICRVWGYAGDFMGMLGDDLDDISSDGGCSTGLSSNFITIDRNGVEAGTVATSEGFTEVTTCPGDGIADIISFTGSGSSANANFTYIVTDPEGVILGIPEGNSQDFEGAGEGTCLVWGLSYTDDLLAEVGDNASTTTLASGCFDLSDNFITVNRVSVSGGTVSSEEGATELTLCAGDGMADVITFTGSGASADANFTYIITDSEGLILGIPPSNSQDFEGAGGGVCLVWGLSYTGDLLAEMGDNASTATLASGCFDLSDNFITVNRIGVEGGIVATDSGATEVTTCPGDGVADVVVFTGSGASADANFTYIITDPEGVILGIPPGNSQDFEGAGEGTCLVWGLSYTDSLLAEVGDTASIAALASGCFALSDNFITVNRTGIEGGTVATSSGATEVTTCAGDGMSDIVVFTGSGASADANFTYIITDPEGVILGIPPGNSQDFEGAGEGTCLVWGLSYTDSLLAEVGDTASIATLASGCFALSSNFISVVRTSLTNGTVATVDGATELTVCPSDGIADVVEFSHEGTSANANFTYVITDENGIVLGIPPGSSQDFEGAGEGICLVWGLSYTDSLLVEGGDTLLVANLATGCSALSENFITVNRTEVAGGIVRLSDGTDEAYICPSDGIANVLQFTSGEATGANFTYIVTDPAGAILGIPDGDMQDFEGAGIGTCLVYGLAYSGNLTAMVGDSLSNTALSDACYDLSSNFITVVRDTTEAGTVMTTEGLTEVNVCVGDGLSDVLSFMSTGATNANFTYIITDDEGLILGIPPTNSQDFEEAGEGICRVYGLSYTGSLTAVAGNNINSDALSSDCYDLSDNFIAVIRESVHGGTVEASNGLTEIYTCPGDGLEDIVMFTGTGSSADANFTYIITDNNDHILGIPSGDSQDFEGAGEGICRVYGLAYQGNLIAMMGDSLGGVALADGCFGLSTNYITINRAIPEAGLVATSDDSTNIDICVGDGVADVINFVASGASNSLYAYVITDENNVILGLPSSPSQDFEGAGGGVCRVWGLAYTGAVIAEVGDTVNANLSITDGCFDLSDNFIQVNRIAVSGGVVGTVDGNSNLTILAGDGEPDVVHFANSGSEGTAFTYIVTDTLGVILGIPDADSLDFEGAGEGVCRVYGVGYTGNLIAMLGDTLGVDPLSDACFAVSSDFVNIVRNVPFTNNDQTERSLFEPKNAISALKAQPNPLKDRLQVRFFSTEEQVVTLSTYNFAGQLIQQQNLSAIKGWNETTLDANRWVSGIYVVRVENGKDRLVVKVVKE